MTANLARPADVDSVAHLVVDASTLAAGTDRYLLDDANAHHLHRVLRVRSGELVTLTDGEGRWVTTQVDDANDRGWLRQVGDIRTVERTGPDIEVGFALTKSDKPEWVIQKLTELGVDAIVPLVADRSVVRWDADKAARNLARFQAIAREAVQQSRQCRLPSIAAPMVVEKIVESRVSGTFARCDRGGVAFADFVEDAWARLSVDRATRPGTPATPSDPGATQEAGRISVFVGPEGGWNERERSLIGPAVELGESVLRAETAAIAAGVLLAQFVRGRRP